jgi:[ribosomal protein S5]-alanine N-acetyltransferase
MEAGRSCILRPFRSDDVARVRKLGDDYRVARWMTDLFPHPFTESDAAKWIARVSSQVPTDHFLIEADGVVVGSTGIDPHAGNRAGVAELGYWLGHDYWGKGYATDAVRQLVKYAFRERGLRRLEAHVHAPNLASARVLEKAGFVLEGVLRRDLTDREGNILDNMLFARLAE